MAENVQPEKLIKKLIVTVKLNGISSSHPDYYRIYRQIERKLDSLQRKSPSLLLLTANKILEDIQTLMENIDKLSNFER